MDLYRLARPALFATDPEQAHALSITALKLGLHPRPRDAAPASLRQTLFGLDFANPVGMAAGYDKDAEVVDALLALGFGFVEAGTITPLPQPGNPKPRVFRLVRDGALINRLGFNSSGHDAARQRLSERERRGVVGINIGANKESADRIIDYAKGVATFAPLADYLTVNISSPNTPGLRDLQAEGALGDLLKAVRAAREALEDTHARAVPILVKIAPDLEDDALKSIVDTVLERRMDGLIVSNTTVSRPSLLETDVAGEAGGLSGRPLKDLANRMLARTYRFTAGELPLIGVGGIASGADALARIKAGASLVQLYTAVVYEGPELPARIIRELGLLMAREGHKSIADIVGQDAEEIAT